MTQKQIGVVRIAVEPTKLRKEFSTVNTISTVPLATCGERDFEERLTLEVEYFYSLLSY